MSKATAIFDAVFLYALAFVLKAEGGATLTNDPRDPGGKTKFGISARANPGINIDNLTEAQAREIYFNHYWLKAHCDKLPLPLAIVVLDCAVNQGVTIAQRLLQKALGVVADGAIGPKTLAAIEQANLEELVLDFLSWRQRRYAFTNGADTYLRGWSKRVLTILLYIQNATTGVEDIQSELDAAAEKADEALKQAEAEKAKKAADAKAKKAAAEKAKKDAKAKADKKAAATTKAADKKADATQKTASKPADEKTAEAGKGADDSDAGTDVGDTADDKGNAADDAAETATDAASKATDGVDASAKIGDVEVGI